MARMLAGGVDDLAAATAMAAMQAIASEKPDDAPSGRVRARCLDRARDQAR